MKFLRYKYSVLEAATRIHGVLKGSEGLPICIDIDGMSWCLLYLVQFNEGGALYVACKATDPLPAPTFLLQVTKAYLP